MPAHRQGGAAALVVAERLTRVFDDRVAVRDLSLSVGAGEIVSLLGPNGAGKTTTLRMLAGVILPTSGRVLVTGIAVSAATSAAARARVGLLTEAPGLWERLPVRMNLVTYARLQGLHDAVGRVDAVMRRLDLVDRAGQAAGTLSKGLKQRVAIARAVLHEPPVLLLDEPTSGLDPASARQVRELIAELRSEGRAVLVSTHNLAEAEQLSDRIAILKTGLLACDSPDTLRASSQPTRVVIDFDDAREQDVVPITALSDVPAIVERLVRDGKRITRVSPERKTLEEIYLDLVGDVQ